MSPLTRFGAQVLCALFTLVLSAVVSMAAQPDPLAWREAKTLPALVSHLENWLDSHTDLPRSATDPTVKFINSVEAAQWHTPYHMSQQRTTRGLYDAKGSTIFLVRPWDLRNPFDVSVLLHELVHHRQKDSGHWYCEGAQEVPAYRTQDAWLAQIGLQADINWVAVVLEAGCTPRDIHPD